MTTAALTSPVSLNARLDPQLSRWLWLVKWLMVIPHLIVLSLLWVAFGVVSLIAFVAILITGHYPRHLFEFTLGVLRWNWRVAYYAYGALGTDRYPPFTLGAAPDYPATLDIAYPEHLSRGLIWVKWILAVPHYVIIAFFVGGGSYAAYRTGTTAAATSAPGGAWTSGGLIGLLVLIVGVALLLTGRYPRGLFDLLLGMHRWVLRVVAYTALMTDEYPPFRLDMGGAEPSALVVSPHEGPELLTAQPPSGHWTGGRVTAVVLGSVLLLGGLGAAVGATAVLSADRSGRSADGFLTTRTQSVTSAGYALLVDPVELRGDNAAATAGALLGEVRVRATSAAAGTGIFVGIGPADAVETYLADVDRDRLVGLRTGGAADQQRLPGAAPTTPPTQQSFWVVSAAGPGTQELTWTATEGRWAAVVMNADGSRPVTADLSAGATAPGLRGVWIGLFVGAGVALAIGIALILLGTLRRRTVSASRS